jgi:hypothetical protein
MDMFKNLKQTLITDYFTINNDKNFNKEKLIRGYNEKTESWHCIECGEDMGSTNPRQLCGKYFCHNYLNL